jgi:hypothetical protein
MTTFTLTSTFFFVERQWYFIAGTLQLLLLVIFPEKMPLVEGPVPYAHSEWRTTERFTTAEMADVYRTLFFAGFPPAAAADRATPAFGHRRSTAESRKHASVFIPEQMVRDFFAPFGAIETLVFDPRRGIGAVSFRDGASGESCYLACHMAPFAVAGEDEMRGSRGRQSDRDANESEVSSSLSDNDHSSDSERDADDGGKGAKARDANNRHGLSHLAKPSSALFDWRAASAAIGCEFIAVEVAAAMPFVNPAFLDRAVALARTSVSRQMLRTFPRRRHSEAGGAPVSKWAQPRSAQVGVEVIAAAGGVQSDQRANETAAPPSVGGAGTDSSMHNQMVRVTCPLLPDSSIFMRRILPAYVAKAHLLPRAMTALSASVRSRRQLRAAVRAYCHSAHAGERVSLSGDASDHHAQKNGVDYPTAEGGVTAFDYATRCLDSRLVGLSEMCLSACTSSGVNVTSGGPPVTASPNRSTPTMNPIGAAFTLADVQKAFTDLSVLDFWDCAYTTYYAALRAAPVARLRNRCALGALKDEDLEAVLQRYRERVKARREKEKMAPPLVARDPAGVIKSSPNAEADTVGLPHPAQQAGAAKAAFMRLGKSLSEASRNKTKDGGSQHPVGITTAEYVHPVLRRSVPVRTLFFGRCAPWQLGLRGWPMDAFSESSLSSSANDGGAPAGNVTALAQSLRQLVINANPSASSTASAMDGPAPGPSASEDDVGSSLRAIAALVLWRMQQRDDPTWTAVVTACSECPWWDLGGGGPARFESATEDFVALDQAMEELVSQANEARSRSATAVTPSTAAAWDITTAAHATPTVAKSKTGAGAASAVASGDHGTTPQPRNKYAQSGMSGSETLGPDVLHMAWCCLWRAGWSLQRACDLLDFHAVSGAWESLAHVCAPARDPADADWIAGGVIPSLRLLRAMAYGVSGLSAWEAIKSLLLPVLFGTAALVALLLGLAWSSAPSKNTPL